jgi:hypothetical protein
MLLQTYNLTHTMMKNGRDYGAYHRMVQFVDSYDPPVKGLHDDLNFVSPRIGEVRAVTTIQLAGFFYVLAPRILDFSLICIFLL